MPQFDISTFPTQLIWLAIAFVLLYVLMARVALPRIGQVLEERQEKIDDNLDSAEQLRAETEVDSEAYETALVQARAPPTTKPAAARKSWDAKLPSRSKRRRIISRPPNRTRCPASAKPPS